MRNALSLAALLVVVLAASGCGAVGRVTSGDASRGKQLYVQKCGSCHTLADAQTSGAIGPNLDDAFTSVKQQGFDVQTMKDVIRGQIAYPEAPMPANLVEGEDANAVSVYVAQCAGNPSCGVTAAGQAPAGGGGSGGGSTTTTAVPQGAPKPDGKQVFAAAGCGGCHTLKAAGSAGNVGPNLDDLKPSKQVVAQQVRNGGGAMPSYKGRLTDAQIAAVAEYVSSSAGK